MKLIIDIDEETYKEVMDRSESNTLCLGLKLIEAVQKGKEYKRNTKKKCEDCPKCVFFERNTLYATDTGVCQNKNSRFYGRRMYLKDDWRKEDCNGYKEKQNEQI